LTVALRKVSCGRVTGEVALLLLADSEDSGRHLARLRHAESRRLRWTGHGRVLV